MSGPRVVQLKWDRQGSGTDSRGRHLSWFISFYHYAKKQSNIKTDFMPLMCFRKKMNLRRRMRNSDSFSANRMTVPRVTCFWCMKSSPSPTAQEFLG